VPNLGSTTASAGSFTTLNSSGATRLGGLSGNQSLQVNNVASAVNYLQAVGAIAGANPTISAQGNDAVIGLTLSTKSTGRVLIPSAATVGNASNGASQFAVSLGTGYSPGNAWTTNSATFGGIQSTGSSAAGAVGIAFDTTNGGWISSVAPGQGYYNLRFDAQLFDFVTTGSRQFRVQNTGSAVNYIQATGATTGNFPIISAQGSDADISLNYDAKGTGAHLFRSASGATQFAITSTSGAVDYPVVTGGTGFLFIGVAGTSANIGFTIASKGALGLFFKTGGSLQQVQISHAASAVNYLNLFGSATNSGTPANAAPTIAAAGSDTDINLRLTPKGTGTLQFGTYTAGIIAQAGYITITDAGGTSRRLLVG